LGGVAGGTLARKHRVVNLAERLQLENTGVVKDTTDASTAFRDSNKSFESLEAEARGLRGRYTVAARWCGAWVGLVIGLKLLSLAIIRKRPDYEADQSRCLGCARCYRDCPQELQRLGLGNDSSPRRLQPDAG
jgi:NAD-dependent dihydropyrimidine dehydrogenase PreA subunit